MLLRACFRFFLLLGLIAVIPSAGWGKIGARCPKGMEYDAGLCYKKCKKGYKGVGPVCWQICPKGFRDDGAYCKKPKAYGRGTGRVKRGCEKKYGKGKCEKYAGLWYKKCKKGFVNKGCCVCGARCKGGMKDIGVSCQKNKYGRGVGKPVKIVADGELFKKWMTVRKRASLGRAGKMTLYSVGYVIHLNKKWVDKTDKLLGKEKTKNIVALASLAIGCINIPAAVTVVALQRYIEWNWSRIKGACNSSGVNIFGIYANPVFNVYPGGSIDGVAKAAFDFFKKHVH